MYYTVLAVPTETRAHRRLRGARACMKAGRISSNVKECKFGLFSSRRPTSNVNNKSVLRSIIYLISLNELFHITRSINQVILRGYTFYFKHSYISLRK